MTWLIYDITAVVILLVCIFATMYRGFVAAIVGFLTLAASMFAAFLISNWLAPVVYNKFFMESVHARLQNGEPGVFAGFLSIVEDAGFAAVDKTGVSVIRFFSMIFFFVLVWLLLRFLTKALRKINKVPLLGPVNKALGAVLGLIIGVLICVIASTVVAAYIEASGDGNAVLNSRVIEDTYVFEPIYRFNLLNLLQANSPAAFGNN